jgi:drug/metabolite transporter superfamily protein YnfA
MSFYGFLNAYYLNSSGTFFICMVKKRSGRFLFWAPRVLAIMVIVFLALFSFDVFEKGFSLLALGGFFIHSIPSIALLVALVVFWRHDKVAGVAFLILWFLLMVFLTIPRSLFLGHLAVESVALILPSPLLVIGVLFLVNWHCSK